MPLPRHRLDGCACKSPLAHFYIHHAESSVRELHPFTTITHLATQNRITPSTEDEFPIEFLFRKRGRKQMINDLPTKKHGWATGFGLFNMKAKPTIQWTDRLAGLADQPETPPGDIEGSTLGAQQRPMLSKHSTAASLGLTHRPRMVDIGLRLEGPYFTPAEPQHYKTAICFVAGTGVSGALAIAGAFVEMKRQQAEDDEKSRLELLNAKSCSAAYPAAGAIWERCLVVWSVREDEYVDLPYLKRKFIFSAWYPSRD